MKTKNPLKLIGPQWMLYNQVQPFPKTEVVSSPGKEEGYSPWSQLLSLSVVRLFS